MLTDYFYISEDLEYKNVKQNVTLISLIIKVNGMGFSPDFQN